MATTRRRRTALTGALVAGLLFASGCSIQIHSEPDPTIDDDTLLVAGDTGHTRFDRNFNPYLTNARPAAKYVYEPLLIPNSLDGELTPWLAESWDQPDPATIEMTLREGVTWQDGTELTADDVVFTFEMLQDNPAIDTGGVWARLESVQADGSTVTFQLRGDDSPALPVIGSTTIVPEHIWADVEDPSTWRNEEPVGSGPFTLGNFTPLQYTMDRYDGYWQDVEVEHVVLPAATQQLDLVTRGFDWGYSFISDVEGTWGTANERNRYWFPPGGVVGIQPNHDVAPFDDQDVRRGIALALDTERIADVSSEGHMDAASASGLLLPRQEDLLAEGIPDQGVVQQDQDAAVEAFEGAGFTYRDGTMRTPDGAPFSFSVNVINGYTGWVRAAQELQRQLGQIGIEVKAIASQPAAYEAALTSGDYEVAIGTSNSGGNVYQGFNNLLNSDFYAPIGENAQNDRIRYRNDQVDRLLRDYRSTVDPDQQLEITQDLQRIFYDDLPIIPLYYGGLWGLYNDGRFTGWPSEKAPYAALETYSAQALLVLTNLRPVEQGGAQ